MTGAVLHGGEEPASSARRQEQLADQPGRHGSALSTDLDGEPVGVLVVEQHEDQLGLGDLAGAAGDQPQRLGAADLPEQHAR